MNPSIENLLTISEISKTLGKTKVRVWQLVKGKKLKGVKRGGIWFVYPDSLRAYISQETQRLASIEDRKAKKAARAEKKQESQS